MNDECEVKCESDEGFITLWNEALVLSDAENALIKGHWLESQWPKVTQLFLSRQNSDHTWIETSQTKSEQYANCAI